MDDDLCQAVSAMNAEGERRGHLLLRPVERERNLIALSAPFEPMHIRWTGSVPHHWVERQ